MINIDVIIFVKEKLSLRMLSFIGHIICQGCYPLLAILFTKYSTMKNFQSWRDFIKM